MLRGVITGDPVSASCAAAGHAARYAAAGHPGVSRCTCGAATYHGERLAPDPASGHTARARADATTATVDGAAAFAAAHPSPADVTAELLAQVDPSEYLDPPWDRG